MKLVVLLLVASGFVGSQTAKVVVIRDDEASQLKIAYQTYKDAETKYFALRDKVTKKYKHEDWKDVEFSEDFTVMVPYVGLTFNSGSGTIWTNPCWGSSTGGGCINTIGPSWAYQDHMNSYQDEKHGMPDIIKMEIKK